MAQFDIYIDTNSGQVVSGLLNPSVVALPPFVQGDTPGFRIWLLARTPTFPLITPYTLIPTAGLSLEAAIGDKFGDAVNYYSQQFVWAASVDPNNPNYWLATFPLNTAAITTLIGHAASASTTFEVKYLTGGIPTTVLSMAVTIQAAVIKAGAIQLPPGLTALSAEYANATFLTRVIIGQIIFKNVNTGKTMAVFLGDDGSFHEDMIS